MSVPHYGDWRAEYDVLDKDAGGDVLDHCLHEGTVSAVAYDRIHPPLPGMVPNCIKWL